VTEHDIGPRPSDLAPGLMLAAGVELGRDVLIGCNVVIHGNASIADGCAIGDLVVLGKPPSLSPTSRSATGETGRLRLAEGAQVGAGAVVLAGVQVGAGAIVGDQAFVREGVQLGAGSVIGRGTAVGREVRIGDGVRIQSNVQIATPAVIEDRVFIGPCVITTNDPTAARHAEGQELQGPVLRRGCRVGAGALLMPGVEVGEEAFVAAGALVTRDVAPRTLVVGSPARPRREISDEELLDAPS
jgi:acetyltransferase-like isoleucine patch superfamily enzyme